MVRFNIRGILALVLISAFELSAFAQDAGKKYAVLIGVKRYDNVNFGDLYYTENDVVELAKILKPQGFEVTLLSDSQDAGMQPKRDAILKTLDAVLKGRNRHDTVVFAFAGHGLQFEDDKANYFVPRDAEPNDSATMISLKSVYEKMEDCGAGVKLLFVDACRNQVKKTRFRAAFDDMTPAPPRGVCALFSCSAGQSAMEINELKHGLFFHHVLQGLRGSAKDERGEVTVLGLAQYAMRHVKLAGFNQVPVLKGEISDGTLVKYAASANPAPAVPMTVVEAKTPARKVGGGKSYKGLSKRMHNFAGEVLEYADFEDADLFLTNFRGCKLAGANFRGADLTSATLSEADLTGADFEGATLKHAGIQSAILKGANLEGLDLQGQSFLFCDLREANLKKAKNFRDLNTADLRNADIRGTNFLGAQNMASAKLKGAKYDKETRWPLGYDYEASGAVLVASESGIVPIPGNSQAASGPVKIGQAAPVVNPGVAFDPPPIGGPPIEEMKKQIEKDLWGPSGKTTVHVYNYKSIQFGQPRTENNIVANNTIYPVRIVCEITIRFYDGTSRVETKNQTFNFMKDEFKNWTYRFIQNN